MIIETGLWGGPAQPPCVLEAFARTVEHRPDALAVVEPGLELTYRDLAVWIGSISEMLGAAGIGHGDTVAVTGPRCAAAVAAAWAVIGAGATYLPLDGNYPRKRLTHVLDESGATLVLHVGPEPDLPVRRRARIPEWSEVRPQSRSGLHFARCRPEAPVYVIYTSGSTGRPKGVVVPHRCVDNMAHWQQGHSVRPDMRTAQFAPLNFDIWFQETLSTHVGGGTLVIMAETLRQDPLELMNWLVAERIERLFLPCVALHMLSTAAAASDSLSDLALREINVAGEQLVCTPAIKEFFHRLPECRLDNHYGQSESHTVSSHILTGPSETWPALASIGRPLPGCEILLDTVVGETLVGELLVAGLPLTNGYLEQPELTAQKYVPVGPTAHGHTTAFRTGDLVSVEGDAMAFLGRVDDEVKIRGYRVNPLEVEACLGKQPGVAEAVCVSVSLGVGSRQLRAAVTVADGTRFDPDAALAAMREELPPYMVPPFITVVESLPRASSGKADRGAIARRLGPASRRSESGEGSRLVR